MTSTSPRGRGIPWCCLLGHAAALVPATILIVHACNVPSDQDSLYIGSFLPSIVDGQARPGYVVKLFGMLSLTLLTYDAPPYKTNNTPERH